MLGPVRAVRLCILLVLGAMVAVTIHAAQDPPQRQPFQTDINYVRVDMYPTIGGTPVTDLVAADVEVLEDGVLQKVAQFERVAIGGQRSQAVRRDPSTMADMREAARDPKARLFVLFLDPRHVDGVSSMQIRRPLIDAINQLVGGDDLIAIMTPAMSARDLTFTRRTTSIEGMLSKYWGEKGWDGTTDPIEFKYEACYPHPSEADIPPAMKQRRREKLTLDALEDLAEYLRTLREERKAVMTISEGWPLYGPDARLRRPIKDLPVPEMPMTVDPRTGRPTTADPMGLRIDYATCENDRSLLSDVRHEERFLRIMQAANRANVSFYPIDPRGLSAQSMGLAPRNQESLRTMATATDGLAIVNAGDMDKGLRRVIDDLSSYYLLAYYSPAKPDGKFHRISVRVKRPGVDVRARSGYLAAKLSDAVRPAVSTVSGVDGAEGQIVAQALGTLGAFTRERSLRVQAATGWTAAADAVFWVVAEISRNASGDDWSQGGNAEVKLVDSRGTTLAAQEVALPPSVGPMSARVLLKPAAKVVPGEYQVQVRVKGAGALPATDTARISLAAPPDSNGVLFNRRGITSGNREAPTADLRFRRSERLIVLLPTLSSDAVSARLLDRTGKPISIPVSATIREDADGSRWRVAELALAPLATGDYLIELTAPAQRTLTAFRVLP